jgi:hypothetical protein
MKACVHRYAAILIISIVTQCGPIDQGVVVGSVANPDCKGCYFSGLDNPTVTDFTRLSAHADQVNNTVLEFAERTDAGVRYAFFSMAFTASGDPARGATASRDLIPVPASVGTWQSTEDSPLDMRWEVHGIELGYKDTEAAAEHLDVSFAENFTPAIPVKIRLDPRTMLVPVQLIRVLPPPSSELESIYRLREFSQRSYKQFWDDRLPMDTKHISHPDQPNATSIHNFPSDEITLPFTQPDQVWNQCGIQFRMMNCSDNDLGCPDLIVDSVENIAPTECESGGLHNFSHMRQDFGLAESLPGVTRDLPIMIAVSSVSGDCLGDQPIDVGEIGKAALALSRRSRPSPLAAAHELGHVLGLNDDDSCTGEKGHLMCSQSDFQRPIVRPADCARARRGAVSYVKLKWNVDVQP